MFCKIYRQNIRWQSKPMLFYNILSISSSKLEKEKGGSLCPLLVTCAMIILVNNWLEYH